MQKKQEIIGALGNICHSETPDRESFFRDAKFYKIDEAEKLRRKCTRLSSCARIRSHDCFRDA